MISAWTKNCKSEKEKEQLENSILGSKIVLRRLEEILQDELLSLDNTEVDPKVYDSPNWAALQAHKNGQRSSLKKVLKLINLDQG